MSLYDSLPLGPREIRVLEILHEPGEIPCCSLKVISLDSQDFRLDYALSYVWGPPATYGEFGAITSDPIVPVRCNGREILVTENIASFFRDARGILPSSSKKGWIDAICINQDDINERSLQVQMMGKIYSSALSVVVWLGDEDEYTLAAITLLEELAVTLKRLWQGSNADRGYGQQAELDRFLGHEDWRSVVKFFQRTFFARAWVIQEVALARATLVCCGSRTISWDTLVQTSHFMASTAWGTYLDQLATSSQLGPKPNWHVPTFLFSINDVRSEPSWVDTLLYSLVKSRDFIASDPRDKIYCLLGLVEEHIRDKPLLKPVYGSQSVATTYTKAAAQILQSGTDLYLLSCVEGELFQRPEFGKLPSWVPDWTSGKSTGLLITGYKRYAATRDLTQRPLIDHENWTLTLQGMKIDTVSMVGEAKHEAVTTGRFPRWLEIVKSLPVEYRGQATEDGGIDRLEAFWRTLIRNTSGFPPKIVPESSPLAEEFSIWLRESTAGWADTQAQELLDSSQWGGRQNTLTSSAQFATTFTWAKHLRLFRTAGGHLGQGSESMKELDQIWILPGSRVPLILRPVESRARNDSYRLVGGAYVHGIMNGEAPGTAGGQPQFTKLIIE